MKGPLRSLLGGRWPYRGKYATPLIPGEDLDKLLSDPCSHHLDLGLAGFHNALSAAAKAERSERAAIKAADAAEAAVFRGR